MATTERFHTLTSPWLDGMLKARYDTYDAVLIMTYAGKQLIWSEDQCDDFLRIVETPSPDYEDAAEEIAALIVEVLSWSHSSAYRVATWFTNNAKQIAKEVYA